MTVYGLADRRLAGSDLGDVWLIGTSLCLFGQVLFWIVALADVGLADFGLAVG